MIKNTHKVISDYAEACRQGREVYNQAVNHIKKNYLTESELFKSAMNQAQETLRTAIQPMKDECRKTITAEFEAVRKAVAKAVTAVPSNDLVGILPLIREGKLKDTELKLILDAHKGNYLESRMLYDAMGERFTSVEDIVTALDSAERKAQQFLDTYNGESLERMSYNNALILNGSLIGELDSVTDEFLTTYGGQNQEA